MKRIYKILSLVALGAMTSCNLDDKVYDDLPASKFPENAGQLEAITNGAYSEQRHLLDDWGWWLYAQEVSSDVLVFPQRGTDWEDGGKWRVLNRHTWNATSMPVQNMWKWLFSGVTKCNQAIEFLEAGASTEAGEQAKAEMRVLRSYIYSLLIDNYGDVPYTETFNDAEVAPFRVKRGDITDKLIAVVEEALPMLNDAGINKHKVSKEMAYMLLGKLHLNRHIYKGMATPDQADMDKVAEYMNMVIGSSFELEANRLAPFFASNQGSSENIFTILNDENADDGMRHNFRTMHTLSQQTFDLLGSPWNGCAIKPDFYLKYFAPNDGFANADDITTVNEEVVDQRASAFLHGQQFAADGSALSNDNGPLVFTLNIKADVLNDAADGGAATRFSGYRVVKYEVEEGADAIMNNDFPVFRLADAYLMRAEATLRGASGAGASADADLNMIRNAAGLSNTSATLDEVLAERARELFMEGHRRSDLIRFGKFADRDWWIGADENGAGPERLLFPLPQDQVDANPNLSAEPIAL